MENGRNGSDDKNELLTSRKCQQDLQDDRGKHWTKCPQHKKLWEDWESGRQLTWEAAKSSGEPLSLPTGLLVIGRNAYI